jgi:hypothetical protein
MYKFSSFTALGAGGCASVVAETVIGNESVPPERRKLAHWPAKA